jgi:hypothetical protein
MIICAFENSPSIPGFLVTKIVYIGYGQLKKMTPFPFIFPQLCSLYFYILLLLMPVLGSVLLLYAGAHKISLKYLFPEKRFMEVCCQKCQKCNTICVTTFFYWISRVCQTKRIKYIHQNLRYYETIEQIHFMVEKIESYAWGKKIISDPLLYRRPPSPKTTNE